MRPPTSVRSMSRGVRASKRFLGFMEPGAGLIEIAEDRDSLVEDAHEPGQLVGLIGGEALPSGATMFQSAGRNDNVVNVFKRDAGGADEVVHNFNRDASFDRLEAQPQDAQKW